MLGGSGHEGKRGAIFNGTYLTTMRAFDRSQINYRG